MQFDQTSITAWDGIYQHFSFGSPCYDACQMTDLTLCESTISAFTQACSKEGVACCERIANCSGDEICTECANGMNPPPGICDANPFFRPMIECLMALPNKACSW